MTNLIDMINSINYHNHPFRHHGLGVLQFEINEYFRVHLWHPALITLRGYRAIHDHRFDLDSFLAYGSILNINFEITHLGNNNIENCQKLYSCKHAKIQSGDNSDFIYLENCEIRCLNSMIINAQDFYTIPRRNFHTSIPLEPSISIIERYNFDDNHARVIGNSNESGVTSAIHAHSTDSNKYKHYISEILHGYHSKLNKFQDEIIEKQMLKQNEI